MIEANLTNKVIQLNKAEFLSATTKYQPQREQQQECNQYGTAQATDGACKCKV